MMKATSLHKQLVSILLDLEVKYLELLGAKKWKGVGVNIKHEVSAYTTKHSPAMNITCMLSTLAKTPFLSWNG